MDVHFVSTLTADDEDRYAPMVINTIRAVLDQMPISYTLRVETANARVFQHSKADGASELTNARTHDVLRRVSA
jgi:hypothetical protein